MVRGYSVYAHRMIEINNPQGQDVEEGWPINLILSRPQPFFFFFMPFFFLHCPLFPFTFAETFHRFPFHYLSYCSAAFFAVFFHGISGTYASFYNPRPPLGVPFFYQSKELTTLTSSPRLNREFSLRDVHLRQLFLSLFFRKPPHFSCCNSYPNVNVSSSS